MVTRLSGMAVMGKMASQPTRSATFKFVACRLYEACHDDLPRGKSKSALPSSVLNPIIQCS